MSRKPKTIAAKAAPIVLIDRVEAAPKPLELADLAFWFGADRWAALEKQAATARAWDGNKFRHEAGALLDGAVKRHPAARETALHVAAMGLLIALGSAPSAEDRSRRPVTG